MFRGDAYTATIYECDEDITDADIKRVDRELQHSGLIVQFMTPPRSRALVHTAMCSRITPFGFPVLPEVKITNAGLLGLAFSGIVQGSVGRSPNKDGPTTRVGLIPESRRAPDAEVRITLTPLCPRSVTIVFRRLIGCFGSKGTHAPPVLSSASIATIAHFDFSKHTGTKVSGPIFP